jgi:hypothetical protein
MPLGAARISFLAKTSITAEVEVIRKKLGVRVEGTAEIDTAQYKFGGASFVADGSGDDNLAIDQNAYDWTVFNNHSNSDNYTIECWIRVTSTSSHSAIFGTRTSTASHNWDLEARSDTSFRWFNGNSELYSSSTGAWSLNTWHHVAAVIEGANLNVYVDGTAVITQTRTDSNTTGGQDFFIGKGGYPTLNRFYGNIDEFRISDTARYTGSFNPSPVPFVNDDNTILLLHMDGTDGSTFFEDDNGNHGTTRTAVAVDAGNDANSDTSQYKFGDASLYLDGTDDYLEVGGDTFLDDFVNTSPWTIEYWIRPQSTSGFETHFGNWGGSSTRCFFLGSDNGSQLTFYWVDDTNTIDTTTIGKNSGALTVGSWNHVALTNDGTNFNLYSNGTRVATGANDTIRAQAERTRIGASATNNEDFLGHIDEFRISTVERYSGTSYTQPTSRFINDTNTLLLLHFDGEKGTTTFTDDNTTGRSKKGIFTRGNVQTSTTQSKFGGSSAYFTATAHNDGTSDSIRAENSDDFTFSGDLTWECWFYPIDNGTSSGTYTIISNRGSFTSTNLYVAFRQTDNKVQWGNSTMGANVTTTTFAFNTWHHVALVREGTSSGNFSLYVNGTQEMTDTDTNTIGSGTQNFIAVGCIDAATPSFGFNGYIDEVRISDNARYSGSSYATPTTKFTNDDNTLLLIHMDGTDASTDFRDDNGIDRSAIGLNAEGNTQIDTAQSNFGGTSAVFDGTGDYLTTNGPDLGSGEWTIEMFARFDSVSGVRVLYDDRESANTATGTVLIYTNGTTLYFNSQQANRISGGTLATNTWYHIAVVRDSSNDVKMYLDGTQIGTSWNDTSTYSQQDGDGFFGMNHQSPNNHYFDGYIDEVRFSDTARYTAGFTAPTETFQNDANTLLLLHMDGTDASTVFIDDNGYYPNQ